jgi:hypothetical protein
MTTQLGLLALFGGLPLEAMKTSFFHGVDEESAELFGGHES